MVEAPATLQVVVLMIICFSFGLGLLGFSGIHFHLVLQNKTTLESYDDGEQLQIHWIANTFGSWS